MTFAPKSTVVWLSDGRDSTLLNVWVVYLGIGILVGISLAGFYLFWQRRRAESAVSDSSPEIQSNLLEADGLNTDDTEPSASTSGISTSQAINEVELANGATRAIWDALRVGLVVVEDHRVVYTNPAAEKMRLVRNEQLRDSRLNDLIEQALISQEVQRADYSLSAGPFQPELTVHARAHYLSENSAVLIAEDTSESTRVEAVRRDFTVNVSHELKTPVGAISLLAETILDAPEDSVMVERFAKRMHTEAQRLANLVQDIMDLSRLQDDATQIDLQPTWVNEIIMEAKNQASTAAQAQELQLMSGDIPRVQVLAQPSLLVTALRNLLDNAVNYSEPHTTIAIGANVTDNSVNIVVADQGMGIPESDLERIFERFYRVDAARARKTGGTGLGLSIVKHIVADHGGSINVWSEVNHGTTFTITLPLHSTGEKE